MEPSTNATNHEEATILHAMYSKIATPELAQDMVTYIMTDYRDEEEAIRNLAKKYATSTKTIGEMILYAMKTIVTELRSWRTND